MLLTPKQRNVARTRIAEIEKRLSQMDAKPSALPADVAERDMIFQERIQLAKSLFGL